VAKVIFGAWQDRLYDNRSALKREIEDTFTFQDFEPGNRIRAFIGWDGFFLFEREVPVIDMLREYVERVQKESCGFCTPCRVGTKIIAERLKTIADGLGREEDFITIKSLAEVIRDASLCELGHTSMTALLKIIELTPDVFKQAIAGRQPVSKGKYHYIASAPCIEACPAHLDIPMYVDAIRGGNYYESLAIIGKKNPLAGVCGRVCVRPCEFVCRRAELDESISIKYLKRFVNDQILSYAAERAKPAEAVPTMSDQKVTIIGAGPCGLTAAFYLRQKGYPVEILEELNEPGGMSAVGIPDYRLPRDIIQSEVRRIVEKGVEIKYGIRVGRDVTLKDLKNTCAAILIAIGAHGSKNVGMEGENDNPAGFIAGVTFLRDMNLLHHLGKFHPPAGTRVAVIGGGNVAMDCARSALRLGYGKVHIIYRRTEKEMPADEEEIRDAKAEGIEFNFLTHPVRLEIKDGKVVGLTCIRMELGEPDSSGRRRPVEVKNSDFFMDFDVVIPAIGQSSDFSFITSDLPITLTKWGSIAVDEETLMTNQKGIFSGGDCVSGPKALIDAMSHGLHVAHCIDQYLCGEKMSMPESERMFRLLQSMKLPQSPVTRVGSKSRCHLKVRPIEERINDFNEIEAGYAPEEAIHEAERCLRCYRIAMFVTDE
jgi:formate dehydrogenase (NADP+) beta subunit